MKKIMFDDHFGLTQAVLEGRKTMTRRISQIKEKPCPDSGCLYCWHRDHDKGCEWILKHSRFKVGEVVAVAQKYRDFRWPAPQRSDFQEILYSAGWNNKMFVRADLMPHQIRITDIRIERIQDISNEDCIREGIFLDETAPPCYQPFYTFPGSIDHDTLVGYVTPREAFAALIKKMAGKKAWDDNPWVFVYEFELVK